MKSKICCLTLAALLFLTGCGSNKSVEQRVQEAFDQGYKAGKAAGTTVYEPDWDVVAEDHARELEEARAASYEEGWQLGREEGIWDGYEYGYGNGYEDAAAGRPYDDTYPG